MIGTVSDWKVINMYNPVPDIIANYFSSEDHDTYAIKNNFDETVKEFTKELTSKYKECEKEDISNNLYAAFNVGEYHGIIQGIGIGIKLLMETSD